MYLRSSRKRRRSFPWRILILLGMIGAGVYVYIRLKRRPDEKPPFVPTPTPTRSAASYISQAEDRYWQGDLKKAIAAYEKAIALEPDDVEPYIPLTRLLTLERQAAEAVWVAEHAVDIAPRNARAWAVLGMAYDWSGEIERAIDACQRAIQLKPDCSSGHAYLAEAYADGGRWDKAAEHAQTALDLDDGSVDAHRNYGYVMEVQGNYRRAIQEYRRALEIHPKLAYIYIAVGKNYLALGNSDAAMRSFQKAAQVDPQNAEAYYRLGRFYYQRGEHDKAETHLKRAIEADPEFGPAFGYLAFTYWGRRNYEEAIPNLQRAIVLESIASRRRARSFVVTVEDQSGDVTEPSKNVVMQGDLAPLAKGNEEFPFVFSRTNSQQATLKPTKEEETWGEARGRVTFDLRSGTYTVTLKGMPDVGYNQAYVGWFKGVNALSGDPLNTGPLHVSDGDLEAQFEAAWVEGPRVEYFYTLGLAHFYMAECEKAYPLFNAALQIDPHEENALKGIRLCEEAED